MNKHIMNKQIFPLNLNKMIYKLTNIYIRELE